MSSSRGQEIRAVLKDQVATTLQRSTVTKGKQWPAVQGQSSQGQLVATDSQPPVICSSDVLVFGRDVFLRQVIHDPG